MLHTFFYLHTTPLEQGWIDNEMKHIVFLLFGGLLLSCSLLSCESITHDDEDNNDSVPLIRLVNTSGNYDWAGSTMNYNYDESGRLVFEPFCGHVSYSQKDNNTVIATMEYETGKNELTLEKNACTSATYYWKSGNESEKRTISNTYSNGRIASRKETVSGNNFGNSFEYVCLSIFSWNNDNLVSWERKSNSGGSSVWTYDYYDHLNPWANSLFDFTSAYFLESDNDDLPIEFVLGYIGKHSKNLLKAVYHDGLLFITLTYDYDASGRISKITERVDRGYSYLRWGSMDTEERSCVFELIY